MTGRDTLQEIITINSMGVNCYLVKAGGGYIIIDTGFSFRRRAIEREMQKAGCRPGNLKLIIITHGDSDHAGNAVYFRQKYGARIAMHRAESDATEKGNMRLNRKMNEGFRRILGGLVFNLPLIRLGKARRFKPDIYVEDGDDFTEQGFDARALHLTGHSLGSVSVLTDSGELFCGDLLSNTGKPGPFNVDDAEEVKASIARIKSLDIRIVYPGHGKPFTMEELLSHTPVHQ